MLSGAAILFENDARNLVLNPLEIMIEIRVKARSKWRTTIKGKRSSWRRRKLWSFSY